MVLKMHTRSYSSIFRIPSSIIILIILALAITSVWTHPLPEDEQDDERRSCGANLAERVNRICQPRGGHKSYTTSYNPRPHSRVRRNIVNECCTNKCADEHIVSYCVNSKIEVPKATTRRSGFDNVTPSTASIEDVPDAETEPTFIALESYTEAPDFVRIDYRRYEQLNRIDSLTLNKLLAKVNQANNYQVGTVPPEYKIPPMMPPRSRIIY